MAENTDNTQQTVDTIKWYFKYDPATYAFIPGAVHEKVDNSTDVEPTGLMNPVWSPSTNTWTGQTYEEFAQEQQAKYKPVSDPVQKQIAGLTQMMIAQQVELAMLKAQKATVTATAQPSQTASQTTSQSASQSTTQSASESTSQSTSAVAGGTTNV
jgi:hypothetical protein